MREDEAAWFVEPPDVNDRPAFHGPAYSDDRGVWDGAGEMAGVAGLEPVWQVGRAT